MIANDQVDFGHHEIFDAVRQRQSEWVRNGKPQPISFEAVLASEIGGRFDIEPLLLAKTIYHTYEDAAEFCEAPAFAEGWQLREWLLSREDRIAALITGTLVKVSILQSVPLPQGVTLSHENVSMCDEDTEAALAKFEASLLAHLENNQD